jgi:3-hydroxyacyl-CoA dehydrogenase
MDIKTITIVGANGTMGANISGIFVSFGNAKVYMISRSIEKSKKAAVKAGKYLRAETIMKNLRVLW